MRAWLATIFINGESMISVKGGVDSTISTAIYLGLAEGPVRVTPDFKHRDINVDAWGPETAADIQTFLAEVRVSMNLIHFDRAVLDECWRMSMGGPSAVGQVQRAGIRMGGGVARFAAGWKFITLTVHSPIAIKPWRFFHSYMTGPPAEFPLGTEKSIIPINWRVVPYTTDPWGGGTGAQNLPIWDYSLADAASNP